MDIILKPFAWLLLFFYQTFSNYGVALILFGLVVKLILFPVTLKSKKSMIQTSMLSGKMKQLQKQYGKDRERYNQEVQKLYEKEGVNPMGGCVWSLIPMFLLIGLFAVIREPLVHLMNVPKDMITAVSIATGIENSGGYPQIAMAKALSDSSVLAAVKSALAEHGADLFAMDFSFLGMDLSAIPNWKFWEGGVSWNSVGLLVLVLVSTVVSFISMKVSMATNQMSKTQGDQIADQTSKTMMYLMPLMSLWIGLTIPAGLTVYWIAQYLMTMVQEVICAKILRKDYEAARKAAEEQARQEKEDEKRRREEARQERARRLEEEKNNKGKKKKAVVAEEPEQAGVNKADSREGLRAYARGRAYMPDRFGGVTEYKDPNERFLAEAAAAGAKKRGKKADDANDEQGGV